jgi:cell division protein FtsQ
MSRAAALRRGLPAAPGVAAPADKRFRRPDVRPGRRRRLGLFVRRAVLAIVGIGGVAAAGLWSVNAVLGARWLVVDRLVVRGNARLSTGEIEALVDGARGQNILLVDLEQFRNRLMDSPWVAGATLRRLLPSTVEVRVVERVPMALARLGKQIYLVDSTGLIMDEFGPQYRDIDLPLVDGLVETPRGGQPVVDPARALLTQQLLAELRSQPDLRRRVSQVDVSSPHDAVVLLDGDLALVHLGEAQFTERLRTYLDLAPALRDQLDQIDYVDMRFDNRVFVKSKGRVTAVAAAPK